MIPNIQAVKWRETRRFIALACISKRKTLTSYPIIADILLPKFWLEKRSAHSSRTVWDALLAADLWTLTVTLLVVPTLKYPVWIYAVSVLWSVTKLFMNSIEIYNAECLRIESYFKQCCQVRFYPPPWITFDLWASPFTTMGLLITFCVHQLHDLMW